MKAAIHNQYGPPSVLQVKEVPKPVLKKNEVLIKVYSATVNRTDCGLLRGKPFVVRFISGLFKPKKQVTGTDFAGIIEELGKEINGFKAGDRVFGFDDSGLCSHAQYLKLSANKAFTSIPENLSYEQSCAAIEGAHYAYNMINKLKIESGKKVLVNGATGAIGSAAVQLLKYYDVHVTAVCDGKNTELIKSIGADSIIDYTQEDFTKYPAKYDFIFDAVGKSTFLKCKSLLKPGGIYISTELGPNCQNLLFALFTPLFCSKKVIFPYPSNIKRSLLLVKKLYEEGKFKALIDRKYRLDQIVEAFTYVESGQKIGNVLITFE